MQNSLFPDLSDGVVEGVVRELELFSYSSQARVGLSYRSFPYLLKPYQTSDPSLVCRLWKALYGLKQAPRASVCKMKDGSLTACSAINDRIPNSIMVM
jgi:hypothetical protein